MTSRDFCFWLQGYFELAHTGNDPINREGADMIRNHLKLVFKHEIDPSMPDPTGELQLIHDGKPNPLKPSWPSADTTLRC